MNYRLIIRTLGNVLCVVALCMIPPLAISIFKGELSTALGFGVSISMGLVFGILMRYTHLKRLELYARDGFAIVGLSWILVSLFGAFPYLFSGVLTSVTDALFESVSGFTTTGASIFKDIEALPVGIVFWRSFTQWLGGMGVLVLLLALLPSAKGNTLHIMRAESPGPTVEKLVPKIGQSAKILYLIYIGLSILLCLFLLFGRMSFFDAITTTFATAGTGGFSGFNLSIGAYHSAYVDAVLSIFMLLFGVNFSLFYLLIFKRSIKAFFKDEELRFYLIIIAISITIITFDIVAFTGKSNFGEGIQFAFFQVASIISSTGFFSTDYTQWSQISNLILFFLMFIGASAGSTSCGMKCMRILIIFKAIKREIVKIIHPKSVQTIKLNGKVLSETTLSSIYGFFSAYILISVVGIILISIDGLDYKTTISAVICSMGNIGIGFGEIGPMGSFSLFSDFSKYVLSTLMIIGRLEIFPILIMLSPGFWTKSNV